MSAQGRTLPLEVSTGCPEFDLAWKTYASSILHRSQILVPDTEEDLNWHGFLGRSVFMDDFRAAEFIGVAPLARPAPKFIPLRQRGLGVAELSALWGDVGSILWLARTRTPIKRIVEILRTHGGSAGASFAEALEHFPHRKSALDIQCLLWNANRLRHNGHSFRQWLEAECAELGVRSFPPGDFRQPVALLERQMPLESALRARLQLHFYYVGPVMSASMICDWMMWLWRAGLTTAFATFRFDAFHEAFLKKFGRRVIPDDEVGFAQWWLGNFPEIPPWVANECIGLAVQEDLVNAC
jgi:hypothetical protein